MQPAQSRRYRILEVLGSGGFGTVYRAEVLTVTGLRREVALKVLNANAAQNEDAAKRLRDEARILSNLNHFGIVRVDDLLQLDGRWTMVMELVHGVDCSRILRGHGPPPPSVSLDIAAAVARTLHAVSKATGPDGARLLLVHRDVKPANILLTHGGAVKLLDFGVARAEVESREAETQQAYVMGSLPYLAPERYGFEDTPAGDVYALGCVLYELFVGKRFGRTHPSRRQHRTKLRDGLHEAWESIPTEMREDLLPILGEALAYEGDDRPAPRDFAARIEALRHRASGPPLADWAESVVGGMLAAPQEAESDDLCGRVLTENLSAESMAGPIEDFDGQVSDDQGLLPVTSEPELTIPEMAPTTEERPRPVEDPPAVEDPRAVEEPDPVSEAPPAVSGGHAASGGHAVSGEHEVSGAHEPDPGDEPSVRPRLSDQPTMPVPDDRAPDKSAAPLLALGAGVLGLLGLLAVIAVGYGLSGDTVVEPERPSLEEVMEEVGEQERRVPELEFGAVGADDIVEEIEVRVPPDGDVVAPTPMTQPSRDSGILDDDEPPITTGAKTASGSAASTKTTTESTAQSGGTKTPTTEVPEVAAASGRLEIHGDAEFVTVRGPGGSSRVTGGVELEEGTYTLFPSFPGGYTVPGPSVPVKAGETLNIRCSSATKSCVAE